uniref:Uncharacterized protein n=1 Tax=Panagrellus redivivus TaxID=6233 RepID=A0A7E4VWL7_PANRE
MESATQREWFPPPPRELLNRVSAPPRVNYDYGDDGASSNYAAPIFNPLPSGPPPPAPSVVAPPLTTAAGVVAVAAPHGSSNHSSFLTSNGSLLLPRKLQKRKDNDDEEAGSKLQKSHAKYMAAKKTVCITVLIYPQLLLKKGYALTILRCKNNISA